MAIAPSTPAPALRPKPRGKRVWKDRHYRWVPDGHGGWRKKTYVVRHRSRPKAGHKRGSTGVPLVISEIGSLTQATGRFTLAPGAYRLWCSLPMHESWGMSADLTVTG